MRRSGGFSLLETLAALALLALILLGVTVALQTTMKSTRSNMARAQRSDELRAAQDYLRRALSGAMPYPWSLGRDRVPVVFLGDANEVDFVASGPGYLEGQGLQLQRLTLVGKEGDKRLELTFSPLALRKQASVGSVEPQLLVDQVVSGRFVFSGVDAQGQPVAWQSSWPYPDRMPTMVGVELVLKGNVRWPVLSVPLRMDPAAMNAREGLARLTSSAVNP